MDHNSLIDSKTYEVYKHSEDYPYAFICDKPLAPVISLLNKKGYKTYASCSGHYKVEFYEYFDEDISYLEEVKKDSKAIIKNVRKDNFDYLQEVENTHIYILFTEEYSFESLPECFELVENDDSRTCIECEISYYDENNKRKKRYVVESEINEKCETLKKWAEKLPIRER